MPDKKEKKTEVKVLQVKESLYYDLAIPEELYKQAKDSLHVDDLLKQGQEIKMEPKEPEPIKVEYTGKPVIEEGQEVFKDDVLAVQKKFLVKKVETRSPVTGRVSKIDELDIEIKPAHDLTQSPVRISVPFASKVKAITENKKLLLEFPGIQFRLFAAKGERVEGKLRYVEGDKLKDKKNPPQDLAGSIIFTDAISPEVYPKLTTLGVKGIIVNSINHFLYNEIIILAVPIGIFKGFGKIKIDTKITKYLQSKEGEIVWFDAPHNRLVIPEENPQPWMNRHTLDLKDENIIV